MIHNRFAVSALALFLGVTGLGLARANGLPQGQPGNGYGQERGDWDAPPSELQEIQRRGFHDGIEGARRDFENHRRPDVNNRDEYRHPSLPFFQREAYRDGFRRGYERAVAHLMGGPGQHMDEPERHGPEMGPGPGPGPELGPGPGSEIQHRGFQDGVEGARRDMENHRRPDVNNRDEYRHPNVPNGLQREYREAFRRGYEKEMSRLMNGGR